MQSAASRRKKLMVQYVEIPGNSRTGIPGGLAAGTEQAGPTSIPTCCRCWKLPCAFGWWKPSVSCRTTERGTVPRRRDKGPRHRTDGGSRQATPRSSCRLPSTNQEDACRSCTDLRSLPNEFLAAKLKEVGASMKHIAHEINAGTSLAILSNVRIATIECKSVDAVSDALRWSFDELTGVALLFIKSRPP